MTVKLSKKAISDLRKELIRNYDKSVSDSLTDEDINELGNTLLNLLSLCLKHKVREDQKLK